MEWELGLQTSGSASTSGGRDGPRAIVPVRWRHAGVSGSGHLTFRVVDGRLECVGFRLGDPGGPSAVVSGTAPEPPLNAALFRLLPMGAIIAAGAKLVSEQHALLSEMRAALEDSPEIVMEVPAPSIKGSSRVLVPAHVIRRGVGPASGTDKRAEELLAILHEVELPMDSSKRRGGRPPVYGDEHYREVARIYSQAWRKGDRHPTLTVATKYTVARSTAAKWVSTARQRGFLGPTPARRAGGVKPSP
jgi:hypothetical protein